MHYIHTIDTERHHRFLSEKRHDPITGEAFQPGDRIVFCASCKAAFSVDSWDYLGGTHCGQGATSTTFPVQSTLRLGRQLGEELYRMQIPYRRIVSAVLINVLFLPKILELFVFSGDIFRMLGGVGLLGLLAYTLFQSIALPFKICRGGLVLGIQGVWQRKIWLSETRKVVLRLGAEKSRTSSLTIFYKRGRSPLHIRLINKPEALERLFWALRALAQQIPVVIHLKDETYQEALDYIREKTRSSDRFQVITP